MKVDTLCFTRAGAALSCEAERQRAQESTGMPQLLDQAVVGERSLHDVLAEKPIREDTMALLRRRPDNVVTPTRRVKVAFALGSVESGEGFGLTNFHKSHPVHSCPVSALHTPCCVRGAAVFCGAMASVAEGDLS